jgi:uncharacterized protein (TIGR02145 family)
VLFRVTAPVAGATYTWGGAAGTISGTDNSVLIVSGAATGTKSVTVYATVPSSGVNCVSATSGEVLFVEGGTAPGATVNFTAFNPCSAAVPDPATTWTLQDTRESGNNQSYKVRKMDDGHIWMVQDMKFGDKCNKTSFTGSTSDQTGSNLTSISGYTYGDCRNTTQSGAGYLYDWAGAIQKAGAYYGSSSDVGCSGTAAGTSGTVPGACQGICPVGWHVPTGGSAGEFQALYNAGSSSWNSGWEGVLGGYCLGNGSLRDSGSASNYSTSTYSTQYYAYYLYLFGTTATPSNMNNNKDYGRSVRCVRNF